MLQLIVLLAVSCVHVAAVPQPFLGSRHHQQLSGRTVLTESSQSMQKGLIFDIGFNKGGDSLNYLGMGYHVVGVEADPKLISEAKENPLFKDAFESGRLVLLHRAIVGEHAPSTLPFWRYGGHDEGVWGSVGGPGPQCAACNSCCHKVDDVKTMSCEQLMAQHGVPLYMKIDIEGLEADCAMGIAKSRPQESLPQFLSFEKPREPLPQFLSSEKPKHLKLIELLNNLDSLGYTKCKVVDQAQYNVRSSKNPYQKSGPFGNNAVDSSTRSTMWQSCGDVVKELDNGTCQAPDWCDIHTMRA